VSIFGGRKGRLPRGGISLPTADLGLVGIGKGGGKEQLAIMPLKKE